MHRRDIKLENTLLDGAMPRPNVKLCDFGYSKNEFVDSRPKTVSGTPDYIAPEVGCVASYYLPHWCPQALDLPVNNRLPAMVYCIRSVRLLWQAGQLGLAAQRHCFAIFWNLVGLLGAGCGGWGCMQG